MSSVPHICNWSNPPSENEEKENGYMQEPNRKLLTFNTNLRVKTPFVLLALFCSNAQKILGKT